ncbi:MAG: PAS domain-containing sensor histidine kinase [bacterium]|nr:PAS domain-containing sensor histidine kinase [bacterium]
MQDEHLKKILDTEEKLKKEQAKFSTLINSLGEAVIVINRRGKITFYNAATLDLLDVHEGIFDQSFDKILPLVDKDGQKQYPVKEVLKNSRVVIRDDLILDKDKERIDLYVNITPITDGTIKVGALALVRNISKQKTLEVQKDEFISIISHELRVPIAVVEGDLSTAMMPGFAEIPEKAQKLLANARQNLIYLSNLLQDLTSLSQAQKSLLDIEISIVKPKELVGELQKDFAVKTAHSDIKIETEVNDNLPELKTSRQRLKEIIVNFLTNAIKYSGKGKIVTLKAKPSPKIKKGVEFSISDQGIGISNEDQKQLFEKAFRSDDEEAQKVKGTGMGLYICKKQAERIGAQLWMKSKFRKGSTFYIEIPINIDKKQTFKS